MKDLALQALDAALRQGIDYADVRVIDTLDRNLSTKSGKPGHVGSSESLGAGIRVLAGGCWGFAATDDLSRAGIESAASLAISIARSSLAKKSDVSLVPEQKYEAVWVSLCAIDPFSIPVEEQLGLLLRIDEELRRNRAITLTLDFSPLPPKRQKERFPSRPFASRWD